MSVPRPVVFLTFAQDREHPDRFLKALEPERTHLQRVLSLYSQSGKGSFFSAGSTDPAELMSDLNIHRGQLVIFHFSGHHNGTQLQLEGTSGQEIGLEGKNLAGVLAAEKHLKLVFLNACATHAQVEALLKAGIPAVIATSGSVNDKQAKTFAVAFYEALAAGSSLEEAFRKARITLAPEDAEERVFRGLRKKKDKPTNFDWGLYLQDDGLLTWRLTDEDFFAERLRAGSRTFFQHLRGPNGRFQHLDMSGILLPEGALLETRARRTQVGKTSVAPFGAQVAALWQEEESHILLLGGSGTGKSVSLVRLWEKMLDEEGPVPVYVSLSEYNRFTQGSKFLTHYLGWNYFRESELTPETENALWNWLSRPETDHAPRVLLLLDGFNEITADKTPLLDDLQQRWRQTAEGVQIILSSRFELSFSFSKGFHLLELVPLDDEQVEVYLQEKKIPLPPDQRFRQLLSNPMMLTLYAAFSTVMQNRPAQELADFYDPVSSAGELLANFIEAQIVNLHRSYGNRPEKLAFFRWILHHLLPFMGFAMEQQGSTDLDELEMEEFMDKAVSQLKQATSDNEQYKVLLRAFPKEKNFWRAARKGNLPDPFELPGILTRELSLLREDGQGRFFFLHQDLREYFAARHLFNMLLSSVESGKVSAALIDQPLLVYLRTFLAELAGEHYNISEYNEETRSWGFYDARRINFTLQPNPTPLSAALDLCRQKFGEKRLGFAVWNLLTACVEVRGELSGADLSGLDLIGVNLNEVRCSRKTPEQVLAARFEGSLLREQQLIPQGHSWGVLAAAFNSSGDRVLSGSEDKTLKLWSVRTGQCLHTFSGHQDKVYGVAFSPAGDLIASASRDKTLRIWSLATGECLKICEGHTGGLTAVAFHPSGKWLFSASQDATVKQWDIEKGSCLRTFSDHVDAVNAIALDSEEKILVSASKDKTLKLWDIQSGECLKTFEGHKGGINAVAIDPVSGNLLSGSSDKTLKLWDKETGACLKEFSGHTGGVLSVAFAPAGNLIISGGFDHSIKVWSVESGECLQSLEGHGGRVWEVAFSPSGKHLLSGSTDYTLKHWDLASGQCLHTFSATRNGLNTAAFAPDGQHLLTAAWDHTVKVWSAEGRCKQVLTGHEGGVDAAAFDPSSAFIASGAYDKSVRLWEVATGRCLRIFEGHRGRIMGLAFHPSGKVLASASYDNCIRLWSVETGSCLWEGKGHTEKITSLAFGPSGKQLYSGSFDDTVRVWSVEDGACLHVLEGHKGPVRAVAVSTDGRLLASGDNKASVHIWDIASTSYLLTLQGHSKEVRALAFSPDSNLLVSGSADRSMKLWDVETGLCQATLKGHTNEVTSVSFSPQGERLLSSAYDGTARIWDLNSKTCEQVLRNIPGLWIQGCSFEHLHPESAFALEGKQALELYGGKLS